MEELLSCHGRLKFQHLDLDRKCSYFNSQEHSPPDINKYYARTLRLKGFQNFKKFCHFLYRMFPDLKVPLSNSVKINVAKIRLKSFKIQFLAAIPMHVPETPFTY